MYVLTKLEIEKASPPPHSIYKLQGRGAGSIDKRARIRLLHVVSTHAVPKIASTPISVGQPPSAF